MLYPLTEGEPLPVGVGDTIKVFYAFRYKVPKESGIKIWASLYNYSPGYFDRKEAAQTKETIILEQALDWKDYSGEIEIVVGQVSPGTYGLIGELPGYTDAEHHIDDCIEVSAPPSMMEMIGPLLVVGLMAGMMSVMAPGMEEGLS